MHPTTTSAPDRDDPPTDPEVPAIHRAAMADGAGMWRVARDSGELDLNTSYAYLVLARDFGDTCRVAIAADRVVAFLLAYRPPGRPGHLFVWQVAVDAAHRGQGLAARMITDVLDSAGDIDVIETTVTERNEASRALFAALARRRGAELSSRPLLHAEHFPDQHEPEPLLVITGLRGHA